MLTFNYVICKDSWRLLNPNWDLGDKAFENVTFNSCTSLTTRTTQGVKLHNLYPFG